MARRYRKIDPGFWNDIKVRELSDTAKLLFLFVLTHPHLTSIGAMRHTVPGLAAELAWTTTKTRRAIKELLSREMLQLDEGANFLWAPHFTRYNLPESPNVVRSWRASFDLLPECDLKELLMERLASTAEGMTKAFRDAFAGAFGKGMPNQEQEQEQEQKKENGAGAPSDERKIPEWDKDVAAFADALLLGKDPRETDLGRVRRSLAPYRGADARSAGDLLPLPLCLEVARSIAQEGKHKQKKWHHAVAVSRLAEAKAGAWPKKATKKSARMMGGDDERAAEMEALTAAAEAHASAVGQTADWERRTEEAC